MTTGIPVIRKSAGALYAALLSPWRASCLPQFDVKTSGAGAFRGVFHWSNLDGCDKRYGMVAAVDERALPFPHRPTGYQRVVETSIPARLDRLRWGGFIPAWWPRSASPGFWTGWKSRLRALLSGALKESPTLHFSNLDVGARQQRLSRGRACSARSVSAELTDLIGRKKLFFITLALYLTAPTAPPALSWNVASYALFRFLTGAGIGGEYTAINSTIQELVPARYRGWTDLGDQRQLLDRGGDRRGRRHRAARSQTAGA